MYLAQGYQRRDALLDVGDRLDQAGRAPGLVLSWDDVPDRAVR